MQIETLDDVLKWTRDLHQHLSECLNHCANDNENQRAQLLLEYLSDHEKELATVLQKFENQSDPKALNTWCYEYLQKKPIVHHGDCDKPFADLSPAEIMAEVVALHEQVIELYRQLSNEFDAPSARELILQLFALEEHEIMRMVQSANRLEDI